MSTGNPEHGDGSPKMTTIEGVTYIIQPLPAMKAMNLQLRIVKLLAPIGVEAGSVLDNGTMSADLSRDNVVMMLSRFAADVDVDLLQSLLVDLCNTATVDGSPLDFDRQFTHDLIPAYMLAFKVFRLNFERYLNALGLSLPATIGQTPQPTTNSSDSSGAE